MAADAALLEETNMESITQQKTEVRRQKSEVNAKNILCGILLAITGWAFWMLMYTAYQMAGGK